MKIPDPTSEQCSANATVDLGDGKTGVAAWYPQMGGYTSHCVIVVSEPGDCADVYVWHDGDFPFGEDTYGQTMIPREIHHCDGGQFIGFGELLVRLQDGGGVA